MSLRGKFGFGNLLFFEVFVMETMKNMCTPSFASMSEEVVLNNIALGFYKLNAVVM